MIQVSSEAMAAISLLAKNPDGAKFIQEWYQHELERLPLAVTNTGAAQGRCQVLQELYKLMQKSKDFKPGAHSTNGALSNPTHTERRV